MMLTQEELNQQFPSDPLPDTRYSVAWYHLELREFVIVYDKLSRKIVYKSNSSIIIDVDGKSLSRKRQYHHIKKFYGQNNCDPPKQVNPSIFEGF